MIGALLETTGTASKLPMDAIKPALAIGLIIVLIYWTLRRLAGDNTDPNVSMSKSSDTGTMSFLASGVDAVLLVVGALTIVLWDTMRSNPALVAFLAILVAAHWWMEKREREGGPTTAMEMDDD